MTAVVPSKWSTKNLRRTRRFYRRKARLAEDVFHFVEDGGIAVGGFVVHFQCRAELFEKLALLARELRRRHHANMVVEIAFTAAARVRKPFALDAQNGAALRSFGDFQFFLAVEAGDLKLGAKSRLRDAERNRAVEIRAASFEGWVLFDFEHNIEIARRAV